MKIIFLSRGFEAKVSDIDYERLRKHRWWAFQSSQSNTWYAYTQVKRKTIFMHRMITGCPKGMEVDHQDNDGLNNQRDNLRICCRSQNAINRAFWTETGFKGVYKDRLKFRARITYLGELMNLGTYATAEEAAMVYDQKAFELFGEFAFLNFRDQFDLPCHDLPDPYDIPF